ncbi:PEP-CTERM sorting domain-containing protein [Aeoliella sp.]|uniref:PEP-CTERM sorting domain-containing protein n=1 Tax=Aeoliella sp. TaxID=2795800 RepID=UPI003CCBB2A6
MTPSAIVSSCRALRWVRLSFAPLAVALLLPVATVQADVRLTGDHSPADSIFTDKDFSNSEDPSLFGTVVGNEGIQEWLRFQSFGFPDPPGPDIEYQHTFEEGDIGKVNIEIGINGVGAMAMDGGSMLRYGHLVIGGSLDDIDVDDPDDFSSPTGVGTVTISGFGTVFNSNPRPGLIPSALRALTDPSPRPDSGTGYDVYVGLSGSGALELSDGGRMEIEDGLYVGQGPESHGYVLVRGIGSVLDQAGLTPSDNENDPDESNPMVIGALGTGIVEVREGGLIRAGAGIAVGSLNVGTLDDEDSDQDSEFSTNDRIQGSAILDIDGYGSRVLSQGGLGVGIWHNEIDEYTNPVGFSSLLTVTNGGSLKISRTVDSEGDTPEEADLLVGKLGQLTLDGGYITVEDRVGNDGILGGSGFLDTGTFRNRRLGTVRVNEDEVLRVTAGGDELVTDINGTYVIANDGLIDVDGGEIVFERLYEFPTDQFFNRIDFSSPTLPPKPGRIHGQNAVMRFRSGLENQAELAFTAGDNSLEGDTVNAPTGNIILSGGANAVFEDDLTNLGDIELGPDGTTVSLTVLGNFTGMTNSTLSLGIGAGVNGPAISNLTVAGNVELGGELIVDLTSTGPSPLTLDPGDEFEIISSTGIMNGVFSILSLPMLSDPTWSWGIDYSNSDFTLVVLDIITLGGDFNGDNFVDAADLAIWQENFGIQMGATGAQGDADMDGDVDIDDYYIWLGQVGGAPAAPIASVTAGQFVGSAVPEPSTVCLLLSAVAGVWYLRRR